MQHQHLDSYQLLDKLLIVELVNCLVGWKKFDYLRVGKETSVFGTINTEVLLEIVHGVTVDVFYGLVTEIEVFRHLLIVPEVLQRINKVFVALEQQIKIRTNPEFLA